MKLFMSRPFHTALILTATLTGCATAQKDYAYMAQADYQSRPALQEALINPSAPLNEASVQKILASKVSLPARLNLAVVRLSESNEGLNFQTISPEVAEKLYETSQWGERVKSITPMPQMMVAKPATLTSLREAAVLLQADALLVIRPMSYGDWKFRWFKDDQAKATTSLEMLLLDTRTSVVPYTAVVSESAELEGQQADYNNYELVARAKKASETKALLRVAPAVAKFLKSI